MYAALISAVMGAILATANVAELGEPHWIATRSFVRTAMEKAASRQISIEIRIEEGERRRIKAKIDELRLELEKSPNLPESVRRIINDQINEHQYDLVQRDETIKNLRRLQSPP